MTETRQRPTRETAQPERADLTAWRRRHELRRSAAAQPVPSKRTYRRAVKHRKREQF
ncbi:hypothetical protein NDR87_07200 [Nocardia sp. CDC159]|uniref:Uncharacterized protein n=1 Tax=Nocardia pulmonis TaxID=2951408 RepID=A0A9X2E550_9NOCA|nr:MULTISPECIES: hypothetical protein [Nocardia]MCM6773253.1 hypothetical protein [Nocardia pulmonis]MCM6786140.1 hypothetical protein [Nocardia sp. CDC159]